MTSQTADQTMVKLRNIALGPYRFANIQAMFELGIVDLLRQKQAMTAREISAEVGVDPDHIDQLMLIMIKEGLIGYDGQARIYTPTGLRDLTGDDCARISVFYKMVKTISLRQLFYLADSVRERRLVGLSAFYGFNGTLYEATALHQELKDAWEPMMDLVSSVMDPWFLEHVDLEADSRVMDLAGNTGLGAINTYNAKQALEPHVTCFDLPEKETEALENFRAHGLEDGCSFFGGNVFDALPAGFDVIMIKNFLEMFDPEAAHAILRNVHDSLRANGKVYLLVPVHPEDPSDSCSADFFPGYFLGCTMGQGGPQKASTYSIWLTECGFEVTETATLDTGSLVPEGFYSYGIICASKA